MGVATGAAGASAAADAGAPKGKTRNQIPDDAESLRLEEQARVKAEAAMSDNMAAGAEGARANSEEAAGATGRDLPAIRPTVVAPAPPPRIDRTARPRKVPWRATAGNASRAAWGTRRRRIRPRPRTA